MAEETSPRSGFQVEPGSPERYERFVSVIMGPFIEALLDAVRIGPGDSVLDVGCGTGLATRAAAARAGAQGRVTGVDINELMLAEARAHHAEEPDRAPMEFVEADAARLPWGDGAFDVVICQQAMQFLPDPPSGLAEMRRVARPGGVIGATVWEPLERNPYLREQTHVLQESCGIPATLRQQAFPPDGIEGLRAWAHAAGIRDPEVHHLERIIELPSLEDYIVGHLRALPWAAPFFELPEATRRAAVDEMIHTLAPFIHFGTPRIPFGALVLIVRV